jgi:hypothetical protein
VQKTRMEKSNGKSRRILDVGSEDWINLA